MTTAEDVFWLYERNSKIYHNCKIADKIDTCPTYFNNTCFCFLEQSVYPFTIGNDEVPCNIKRKCYIKQGEECPICMEKILSKSNAYLSVCGHCFHKLCIFKCMETKWVNSYASNFNCPMCRKNLGTEIHETNRRYNFYSTNDKKYNYLDMLEDFWIQKDLSLGHICDKNYNHYLGMNTKCIRCKEFITTGK